MQHGAPKQDAPGVFRFARHVDAQQTCREEPHERQHHRFAHAGQSAGQHGFALSDAHHEIGHRRGAAKEDAPGHAFAIEHEEKGEVDERRPRFFLHHDEREGQKHDARGVKEVVAAVEREAVLPDHFGDHQCRGAFGKLGRLQRNGTQRDPRARTFDVVCYEGRDEQQRHHAPIEEVGQHVEIAVVEHQDHAPQPDRAANPDELLAGSRVEGKKILQVERVAGAAHAEPPEGDECQKEQEHPTVGTKGRIELIIAHGCHS